MTTQELDALQALCDKANAAPWEYMDNGFDGYVVSPDGWLYGGEPCDGRIEPGDPNAAFVISARTALPELIAEVRRMQERCEAAEAKASDLNLKLSDTESKYARSLDRVRRLRLMLDVINDDSFRTYDDISREIVIRIPDSVMADILKRPQPAKEDTNA